MSLQLQTDVPNLIADIFAHRIKPSRLVTRLSLHLTEKLRNHQIVKYALGVAVSGVMAIVILKIFPLFTSPMNSCWATSLILCSGVHFFRTLSFADSNTHYSTHLVKKSLLEGGKTVIDAALLGLIFYSFCSLKFSLSRLPSFREVFPKGASTIPNFSVNTS